MGNTTSDKKQFFKRCIIVAVIVLMVLLLTIFLPFFLLGLQSIPAPCPYKEQLINLANREYKDKENIDDYGIYVSKISSVIYLEESNSLMYAAETDLESDNYLIVLNVETPESYSFETSVSSVCRRWDEITSGYTVDFYTKIDTVDANLLSKLETIYGDSTRRNIDIGTLNNPNILTVSMSYYDSQDNIHCFYSKYDVVNDTFLNEDTYTQKITKEQSDLMSIFE